MKKLYYLLFLILLCASGGCSINIRSKLPTNYTDLNYKIEKRIKNNVHLDESLCEGQLMMLQIGCLYPTDTVSVSFNGKIVLKNITTDYPFPYIDKEEYGGHGEHYYDFLLFRKTNGNTLLLMNLRDPKKKVIAQASVKDSLDIRVVYNNEPPKRISIPKTTDYFLEIRFFRSFVDTLQGVHLFD